MKSRTKRVMTQILTFCMIGTMMPTQLSTSTRASNAPIQCDGKIITALSLEKNEKATLSAYTSDARSYQWMIQIPETEQWVNIYGATAAECEISYALLHSGLKNDKTAKIRNAHTHSDGTMQISDAVDITLVEPEKNTEPKPIAKQGTSVRKKILRGFSRLRSAGDTVTIKYRYDHEAPNATPTIASDHTETMEGDTLKTAVPSPQIAGYVPYLAAETDWNGSRWFSDSVDQDTLTPASTLVFDTNQSTTYYVVYLPQSVNYRVNTYLQNIYDNGYTFESSDLRTATAGSKRTFATENLPDITGFTALSFEDTAVEGDGSTIIRADYDRMYYLLNLQLDDGTGPETVYARYGTTLHPAEPTKAGYVFDGWTSVDGDSSVAATLNSGNPITMPADDLTLKATWTSADTVATIAFWYENPDDENDSYVGQTSISATAGTSISSGDYQNTAFDGRDDTHFTYDEDHAETKTVAADGSTVLDVYFTRNSYILAFADGLTGTDSIVTGGTCDKEEHQHNESCFFSQYDHLEPAVSTNAAYTAITTAIEGLGGMASCNFKLICHNLKKNGTDNYCYYFVYNGTLYFIGNAGANDFKNGYSQLVYDNFLNDENKPMQWSPKNHGSGKTFTLDIPQQLQCSKEPHTHGEGDCPMRTLKGFDGCNTSPSTTDSVYQLIFAKYQADISDLWPLAGATYSPYTHAVPGNLYSWDYKDSNGNIVQVVPKMFTMSDELCNDDGLVMAKNTTSASQYTVRYMIESLDGTGSAYNGINYVADSRFSQTLPVSGNTLTPRQIDGFYAAASSAVADGSNYVFYYRRNRNDIYFNDGFGNISTMVNDVMYETPLDSLTVGGKTLDEYVPPCPPSLDSGAYKFDGWYTTDDFTTAADFDTTMPNHHIAFFAKWTPVTHHVMFFETYEDMSIGTPIIPDEDTPGYHNDVAVQHGATVNYASTLTREGYTFNGWYYIDEITGRKTAFQPNLTPVVCDLNLFADWVSEDIVRYAIHYVTGSSTKVAEDTFGEIPRNQTLTVLPKTGTQLLSGYQTGYFPTLASAHIKFPEDPENIDGTGAVKKINLDGSTYTGGNDFTYLIEYTFDYEHCGSVNYTVDYINRATGDHRFKTSSDGTENSTVESVTKSSEQAFVTERFRDIPLYVPDAYSKRIILTSDPDLNFLTFYYEESDAPMYLVEHYTENVDGTWTIQSQEFATGAAGDTITRSTKEYVGHAFLSTQAWVDEDGNALTAATNETFVQTYTAAADDTDTASGTLSADHLLILRFYYPLNEYSYTVEHRILNSTRDYLYGTQSASTDTGTGKFGAVFEGNAKDASAIGYTVEGSQTQIGTITDDENVLTFWYIKPIEIQYRVSIDGQTGTNVFGCYVTPTTENTKAPEKSATFTGSVPIAASGFKFIGWYTDAECTTAAYSSWIGTNDKLIPYPNADDMLEEATYYAKFEPYTLTIVHIGGETNESFLYHVTGSNLDMVVSVDGNSSTTLRYVPEGEMTVTEITNWSWKYSDMTAQTVTMSDENPNGMVTFQSQRNSKKWLADEESQKNHFSAFP